MNIEKIITLLSTKLVTLRNQLAVAEATGDVEMVLLIESEIIETQQTLSQLNAT